jgi:L-2-hydroxyglutarate oxidase LhgO
LEFLNSTLFLGIVDWAIVTQHYADDFKQTGGEIFCAHPLVSIEQSEDPSYAIRLVSESGKARFGFVIFI